MMAYISLEYASDGLPPAEVDRTLRRLGLRRHGTYYLLSVPSEPELHAALDRLHEALRGSGVRYRASLERPDRGPQEGEPRAEVLRWVDAGLADESLVDLLDKDPFQFKEEALRSLRASVDHVLALHRREELALRERKHREAIKEEIAILLRSTGGRSFREILEAFDLDERTLEEVLGEMADEGAITAHQRDRTVIYVQAGPMLRSLSR